MAENIQGLGRLIGRIRQLATDARHVEKPLKAMGVYSLSSIEKTFRAQGRPKKWQKLASSTVNRRRRGRGRGGPQILIDTAAMKNAIGFRVNTEGVEVGLTKKQAKRMHFGFPGKKGRGGAKTPARPFLLLQNEDIPAIGSILKKHIQR